MEIETLSDAWTHGVGIKMACAKPRREGLKSVPGCNYMLDLHMETLIAARAFRNASWISERQFA